MLGFSSSERWPAGHRAALVTVVQMSGDMDTANSALAHGADYAPTGFQHFMHLFGDLGMSCTTVWTHGALTSVPQLAHLAVQSGHDAVPALTGVAGKDATLTDLIARVVGEESDGVAISARSLHGELPESIHWVLSDQNGDLPTISGDERPIVVVPTSPFWSDDAWFAPAHPTPPSALLESWSQALQSVRTNGGLMTVILNPHLSGRPGHRETIARFLDEAIGAGDVWMPRASELAAWWMTRAARDDE